MQTQHTPANLPHNLSNHPNPGGKPPNPRSSHPRGRDSQRNWTARPPTGLIRLTRGLPPAPRDGCALGVACADSIARRGQALNEEQIITISPRPAAPRNFVRITYGAAVIGAASPGERESGACVPTREIARFFKRNRRFRRGGGGCSGGCRSLLLPW